MRYAKEGTHMPKFCFSRPQSRHSISGRQLPSNASSFPSLPPPSGGAQAGRGGRLPSAGPEAERCCGPATRQRRKSGGLLVRSGVRVFFHMAWMAAPVQRWNRCNSALTVCCRLSFGWTTLASPSSARVFACKTALTFASKKPLPHLPVGPRSATTIDVSRSSYWVLWGLNES